MAFLNLFRYHTDSEEIMLDDALHIDTIRRSDIYDPGLLFGTHNSIFEYSDQSIYGAIHQPQVKNEEKTMGLAEAIVKCILSSGMGEEKILYVSFLFSVVCFLKVPIAQNSVQVAWISRRNFSQAYSW